MTVTTEPKTTSSDAVDEVNDWLEDNWDPDRTLGEWWDRLGMAGWSNTLLPPESYGRGLSRGDSIRVQRAIASFGALGAPAGLGLMLAAPTISTHGTRDQIDRYLPDIVTGRKAWCQLFSEPGAGSDLAGLSCKAERDGDLWRVNGQKVWTSGGHLADHGMLIARTNPDVPKHQGITWFAFDMHQDGVDVRPLREMTGATMFSEVFMSDALVLDDARIGDANNGWAVANTTLLWERSGMGAGGGAQGGGGRIARPGTVANNLSERVGDFVAPRTKKIVAPGSPKKKDKSSPARDLIEVARRHGKLADPKIRQQLMRLHTMLSIASFSTERNKAVRAKGGDIPGIANFSKLLMADVVRLRRDLGLQLVGPLGMLHAYDTEGRELLEASLGSKPELGVTSQALGAQALPIYGGTDQIQKNMLGERTLGLPKEPGDLKNVPFSEMPKNA